MHANVYNRRIYLPVRGAVSSSKEPFVGNERSPTPPHTTVGEIYLKPSLPWPFFDIVRDFLPSNHERRVSSSRCNETKKRWISNTLCMRTYVFVHTYARTYVLGCLRAHVHACIRTCLRTCVYACMQVYNLYWNVPCWGHQL